MPAFPLSTTSVQLHDGGAADAIEVDDAFWDESDARPHLHGGRLIGLFTLGRGDHDEVHPAGDETLILVSGAADVLLYRGDAIETVRLTAGTAFLVPRGTWHTIDAVGDAAMIFITPGAGTEHRPRVSAAGSPDRRPQPGRS